MNDLAKEALTIQDASNLTGLLQRWAEVAIQLRRAKPGESTDFYNRHPINALWASKVHSLAGMGISDVEAFLAAYNWCMDMSGLNEVTN